MFGSTMTGAGIHAGTPPSQHSPTAAEVARPQQQQQEAQPVRKVKPLGPITYAATRMAGKYKTWGDVAWGRRVHYFRAVRSSIAAVRRFPAFSLTVNALLILQQFTEGS